MYINKTVADWVLDDTCKNDIDKKIPKLYVMVGLQGSGKSTIAEYVGEKTGIAVVSSDKIREEKFGNESVQTNPKLVFEILYERIKERLQNGQDAIIDATNINRKSRKGIFEKLKDVSFFAIAVCVDTDVETCKQRNSGRARQVPENVIERYAAMYTKPSQDEGFAKIIDIQTKEEFLDFVTANSIANDVHNKECETEYSVPDNDETRDV